MRKNSKPCSYRAVTLSIKAAEKGKQRSIHVCLPGCLSYTGFSKFNESEGECFLQGEIIIDHWSPKGMNLTA